MLDGKDSKRLKRLKRLKRRKGSKGKRIQTAALRRCARNKFGGFKTLEYLRGRAKCKRSKMQ